MKHLLIVYHSQSGKNLKMAEAVYAGCCDPLIEGLDVRFKTAASANADDLLWADGFIFGTPENFGYMSGALKDFFDRTYYEVEGQVDGKPFGLFVGSGTDGQGALTSIRRICTGYKFKEIQAPIVIIGELTASGRADCREFGMVIAAGLEAGIY
jgi:multimeric flavodoxin WrbA